jgi:hypothetical protein
MKTTSKSINLEAFNKLFAKFEKINSFIESGQDIPKELSKNFISFPLSDTPLFDIDILDETEKKK